MSTYKIWAPKCALPDCLNKVHYHKKTLKEDGTPSYKWKTFCEVHRTVNKTSANLLKKSRGGCENRAAFLGLPWTCKDPDTDSLTVDHWDGDKFNNNQDNLIILCANCHHKKTKLFKDHLTRYTYKNTFFDKFFDIV